MGDNARKQIIKLDPISHSDLNVVRPPGSAFWGPDKCPRIFILCQQFLKAFAMVNILVPFWCLEYNPTIVNTVAVIWYRPIVPHTPGLHIETGMMLPMRLSWSTWVNNSLYFTRFLVKPADDHVVLTQWDQVVICASRRFLEWLSHDQR